MTDHNQEDLTLAILAVRTGASLLKTASRSMSRIEESIGREWKVCADHEIEGAILRVLQDGSNYPILSEETGELSGVGKRKWLVDPLDGSANFSRGLPLYAISVGLWEDGRPILGAVLEMPSERLFHGVVGRGAWCERDQIQRDSSSSPVAIKAILCTGFPVGMNHSAEEFQTLIGAFRHFGKTRMLGSAALMLCYVASGQVDSYWERQIALWDVGAALAIVQAAGGVINISEPDKDNRLEVEAAACENLLVSNINGR